VVCLERKRDKDWIKAECQQKVWLSDPGGIRLHIFKTWRPVFSLSLFRFPLEADINSYPRFGLKSLSGIRPKACVS